jgi:purine-binding chemotaxis protein CheW
VPEVVLFELSCRRYGIPVADTAEILRIVAITPLAKAPPIIEGAVNVRGEVIPVFDIRGRFGLPAKPIAPSDNLIVARAGVRRVAIRTDQATNVVSLMEDDLADAANLTGHMDYIAGIAKLPDGLVLIHDLKTFLTAAESQALDDALMDVAV